MKLIRPYTVTASNLTSNITEADAAEYAASATYAAGAQVMWTVGTDATHHVYESIVDGNIGNALTDTAKWLDLGPTNRFAMFDEKNGTATTGSTIDVSVDVTGRADGLALLGLDATQVYVSMAIDGASHTNLALYSEQFDNAAWTKSGATVTANATIAPTLATTPDKLVEDTSAGAFHDISQTISATSGVPYTVSCYLKAGERSQVYLFNYDGGSNYYAILVDLSTGTFISSINGGTTTGDSYSITDAGGGWYRIAVTTTIASTFRTFIIRMTDAGNAAYNGNGISGVYLWGAQIEQAGSVSPYLATTSSAVTSVNNVVAEHTYNLQSDSGVTSWYAYFTEEIVYKTDLIITDLPLYTDPTIRVLISGDGSVSCGTMVLGQTRELGAALYGARAGIIDYSKKETDDFGNYQIVPRAFAKRTSLKLITDNSDIDELHSLLASYRTTPVVWIGADDYSCTWVFGFYKDFAVEIAFMEKSYISLEIEGLT